MRSRALRTRRAGLVADWGKTSCADWSGCGVALGAGLKVLEWEYVGAGFTGPIERREAAKWGSRPSRSMANLLALFFNQAGLFSTK